MMFDVEQKIDWSVINLEVKDKNILKAFFIDGDNPSYGIVGNNEYIIVRMVSKQQVLFYVQKREDYIKQQNAYFYYKNKS